MFFVDGLYATGCIGILIVIFLIIHYTSPPKSWGVRNSRSDSFLRRAVVWSPKTYFESTSLSVAREMCLITR